MNTIVFSIYNNCYSFGLEEDIINTKHDSMNELELETVLIPPEIIKSNTLKDDHLHNRKPRFPSEEWEIL